MKWIQVKIIFGFQNKELAADLISDIFYDFGLQGVVVESPDMEPEEGWGDDALQKPDTDSVIGYFPKNDKFDKKLEALQTALQDLRLKNKILTRILFKEIDEQDWAESWKAYFWPEKITDKIVVKPTWRDYSPDNDEIILEIDPGMAFGTGTHPTTSLCLQMIENYLKPEDRFLDIGTGSGILMIGASKLGAGIVWGVDIDEIAVDVARQNLFINNINKFKLFTGNLVEVIDQKFDIVAANILSEVILELLDNISNIVDKNGIFICSGIIIENQDNVVKKMQDCNFKILKIYEKDNWVAIAGKMQ